MRSITVLIILLQWYFLNAQPTWIEQVSGVNVQLNSVSGGGFSLSAWVCGQNGTVLRTTNWGYNWMNVSGNGIPSNVELVSIAGISQDGALAAGNSGSNTYVYRSTNGGANWTQVFFQSGGYINAVYMYYYSSSGFMYGNPVAGRWSLWRTINNGASWDSTGLFLPQAGNETGWKNAMWCHNNRIWFGTNNSRIYYSSNGGSNWSVQVTTPEVNSFAVWFFSPAFPGEGLTGGSTTLMQTTNFGSNWSSLPSPGTGNFGGITGAQWPVGGPNFMLLWYVRGDNKIYNSFQNGQNWQVQYTAPSGNYVFIKNISEFNGPFMAVKTNGGITYLDPIYGINPLGTEIPNSFSLYQNYPNPFNSVTKIRFDTPLNPPQGGKFGFVTLKIYDVLGREVTVLVNEALQPGTYEVKFDGTNYPSGIYFYTLTTETYTNTKRMVLIK